MNLLPQSLAISARRPHARYAPEARQARGKLCFRSRRRAANAGSAVLLLRQQQFLQRAFAELAGGGGNAPLGAVDRREWVTQCGRCGTRRRSVRDLAGFLGLV